jgi:hypothetical protein
LYENLEPELVERLHAASYAIPVVDVLRDLADEVLDMDLGGASEKEIDARIDAWLADTGYSYEDWLQSLGDTDVEFMSQFFDMPKLWQAFGIGDWMRECVRSIAFTDEPIPFMPFAAGYWYEDKRSDPPQLIAVMTALSDPDLAARQLKEKHRKMFGSAARSSGRADELAGARMLARHRAKMPYREIAIQNLRNTYPDIVQHPHKYKKQIATERERVVKAIKAAQKLWNARGLGDSIEK